MEKGGLLIWRGKWKKFITLIDNTFPHLSNFFVLSVSENTRLYSILELATLYPTVFGMSFFPPKLMFWYTIYFKVNKA